jgi:signal transduction histidine kinase/DNA-binding response OmpR family regulator
MLLRDYFTILIVDDSIEDRETYRRFLQRDSTERYDIHLASYAREGLAFCQAQMPDVILLDFLLPDLNGIQFVNELLELTTERRLPAILVLTGQGNEEIAVTLMKQGVQDYVLKNKLNQSSLQLLVRRLLERIKANRALQIQQQWQQVQAEVALNIRRSLDLNEILHTAVNEIEKFLTCDRVVVYQFTPDWVGDIVAEAVGAEYTPALGAQIVDTCFQRDKGAEYRQGRSKIVNDIYRAGLSPCHIEVLERFQVRANAVVPILLAPENPSELPRLWGLLIAHQCNGTRNWTDSTVLFLERISVQLAIAIQQAELVARLNQELAQRTLAEETLQLQTIAQQQWLHELAKTTAQLKRRNQELDSFVSIASHDLRAPLRAIRNLATWLGEDLVGTLDPSAQQQFSLLTSRVRQMEALIDDLLDYAQLGRKENRLSAVVLSELVRDVISGLVVPPTFTIDFAPDLPTIVTNATALEQVLTNLIANAIKHHDRSNGRVEIKVALAGDLYRFDIIDDGPGIPAEYHQKMFEIFKTFSKTTTVDSTGIGLAIVKKLVELQGGEISLDSVLGRGTTFSFTWPLSSDIEAST